MSDPNQEFHAPPPPPIQTEPERQRPTWLMWAGVGVFVLGIIIIGLNIAGVLTSVIGTGATVCVLGIMFFGFSFMRLPVVPDAPPKMSTAATLAGIFFEPTRVFRNLRAHPRWLAAILIVGIVSAVYTTAFYRRLGPERIVNFTFDALEQSPLKPPPEALAESRRTELEEGKFNVGPGDKWNQHHRERVFWRCSGRGAGPSGRARVWRSHALLAGVFGRRIRQSARDRDTEVN